MIRNTESNIAEIETNEKYGHLFPIVFSANDNYTPYAGVAIQSIIINANPRNEYRIYVLHTSISAKHIEELEKMTTENVKVRCINVKHMISSIQSPLPLSGYFTEEVYYRILIPEIEELKGYPYAIYLDCDVIINTDIAGIVPRNMGNSLIAGVRDHAMVGKIERRMQDRECLLDAAQYVNSGVMVINIPQWIYEKTSKKCFDFLSDYSSKEYVFMDQDIINAVCKNRIFSLDESWNYNWFLRYGDSETVTRCRAITDRIGENFHVLHYTTSLKPWCTLDHPYSEIFWRYAGRSPFLEEIIKTNLCSKADLENYSFFIHIGRAVTFIPRKLQGGIQCFREHGAGYAVRRTLFHMGLWEDEEVAKGPENRPKLLLSAQRRLHIKKEKQKNNHA